MSSRPTGRTNRRHRKVAKNACNAKAKPIPYKLACSLDIQKLSVSEHNGIPSDRLSGDNILWMRFELRHVTSSS